MVRASLAVRRERHFQRSDGKFHGATPLVLVPANLLPLKAFWIGIVYELGENDRLLILPTARAAVRRACAHVGRSFRTAGSCVTTVSAERLLADCQTVLDNSPYRGPHY